MPRSNHEYRRMLSRLPEEMKTLMSLCDRDIVIQAHHAGSMGWSVDFQIDKTEFRLEYDRGFLVVVKDPAGEARALSHPDFRVEGLEFTAGVFDYHLPVDAALRGVDVA